MTNTIVQNEANRVNAEKVMTDFEHSINKEIADWAMANNKSYPTYMMLVEAYWREVHGIEV